MDPSMYSFTPNNTLPQESKLATYMNRASLNNPIPPLGGIISTPANELQQTNAEFIPGGAFYTGLEDLGNSSQESSPTHSIPVTTPQITQVPATQVHQENVGGTTYFYSTNADTLPITPTVDPQVPVVGPSNSYAMPPIYTGTPTHVSTLGSGMKPGLVSFYVPEEVRSEILLKNELILVQPDCSQGYPVEMPMAVERYVDLLPLEDITMGALHSSYRATNRQTGQQFVLRRLHDFHLSSTKCPVLIDKWKYLQHPNMVRLREVFSTKAFGDNSLIFVYDYHPSSVTLMQKYINQGGAGDSNSQTPFSDSFSSDPDAPRPYTHQKNTILRATHGGALLPEATIWNLLVQLTASLRSIHSSGLACRKLELTKVIMTGYRARLSWCGVDEIAGVVSAGPGALPADHESAQQEDLTALGRMVLALACRTPISPTITHTHIQIVTRAYSPDLKNLILYLLSVNPRRSVTDLMPMIGARFYTQIEALECRADTLEDQLALELDNSRLYKLLVKLATVNERPELHMDGSWAETGDRYMLKLFRDYLFHPVTPDGRPWLDHNHIVYCLNQLDVGTHNKVQLMSRDEQSVLVVSYAELKQCLEQAFGEVNQAAASG